MKKKITIILSMIKGTYSDAKEPFLTRVVRIAQELARNFGEAISILCRVWELTGD
jgi:hypothetical protein